MDIYIPHLLSRKNAINLTGFTRTKLKKLSESNFIRTFKTKGGHIRYFRDDLIKYLNERS